MRKIKNILPVILALTLCFALTLPVFAALPERPANGYVLDSAGVLSDGTEQEIVEKNTKLFEETGAEIVIVAVDFLGGKEIDDYTYELFNAWGIGSAERNNGLLLVMAIGEDNYYAMAGYGIESYFNGAKLDDLLYDNLEDGFAEGDYDTGVKKFFAAALEEMNSYYRSHSDEYTETPAENDAAPVIQQTSSFGRNALVALISMVVRIVIVIVVIVIVMQLFRHIGGGGSGYTGGSGGFWTGWLVGRSSVRRRRQTWYPPPPPPYHPPRPTNPGRRPSGGFGSFGGGRPSGGSRPSGGFSRGGSSFGGRSSGSRSGGFSGGRSGGGFSRGGGSRGGGAGRR